MTAEPIQLNPRQRRLLVFFFFCLFLANLMVFGNVFWSKAKREIPSDTKSTMDGGAQETSLSTPP